MESAEKAQPEVVQKKMGADELPVMKAGTADEGEASATVKVARLKRLLSVGDLSTQPSKEVGPEEDVEQGQNSKQTLEGRGRVSSSVEDPVEPQAKRLKAAEQQESTIQPPKTQGMEEDAGASASAARPEEPASKPAAHPSPSVRAPAPEDDSGPESPFDSVIWPPIIVVQNLRTGVVDGKWRGVCEQDLQKRLLDTWKFQNVFSNPQQDGHRGELLIFLLIMASDCCLHGCEAQDFGGFVKKHTTSIKIFK